MMAHGGEGVRERIAGFEHKGTLQKDQRLRHLRRHPRIDVGLGLQHQVIGAETVRSLTPDTFGFGAAHAGLNRTDHVQGDFVLQSENVVKRAVEALSPQLAPGRGFDHPGRDADTVAALLQAALQQIAHAEFAAGALQIRRHALDRRRSNSARPRTAT